MKKPILIGRVNNDVVLDNGMAKGKYAPTGSVPLFNNEYGVPVSGSLNYCSIIVMLIYFFGYTLTYIAFLVDCCARYMYCPKHFNEEALK